MAVEITTVQDLKDLAEEHMLTFVGVQHDNAPFGPVYIIVECQPSNTLLSEFISRVHDNQPAGMIWKVAVVQ